MERGLTGTYRDSIAGDQTCRAFVPAPLPPKPPLTIDAALQERLDQAHLALGRLDSISTMLPSTDIFLYSYVRKEAVMSSRIEGTQSSLGDLMAYEMEAAPGVPMDDVREVSCYVTALQHGLDRLCEGLPISRRLILEVHSRLLEHGRGIEKAPGEFRRAQNWIGGTTPDRARFVPPPPQVVADCWSDLERFINDVPERTPPLIKAALAHVQFETIHPFLDGNGRLGRMLIPLILHESGVLHDPLLYLSLYFKDFRDEYYERLQAVRLTGDWEGWLGFFADAVTATAGQAVSTAQRLTRLTESDTRRIQALGRISGSALQVLNALARQPVMNIRSILKVTGLYPNTIAKALESLELQLGLVREITGQQRNRVWVYEQYLAILNEEIAGGSAQ